MNSYEMMIDPATFGTVAQYLRNPITHIYYILHVRDRAQLAGLAEQLAPFVATGRTMSADLPGLLAEPLKAGTVRVSSYQPLALPDERQVIPVTTIPRLARCDVIYLPPFYLVHTPGLFEGTLPKATVARKTTTHEPALRPRPFQF
jgi:hypothetical protein